jgi:thiol-disulfide isomerase/thioredoxin
MIKKILPLLLFASTIIVAQNSVIGVMSPKLESDWVILYKIEGTKQVFVNNTKIKTDTIFVGGKKEIAGSFEIQLPSSAKPGAYRATYRLEGAGFVDFFYNKQDVSFIFNPDYPQETIAFSDSSENKFYKNYINAITEVQQNLDSIQVAALQNPDLQLSEQYKKAYNTVNKVQQDYNVKAKDLFVAPFVKASARTNPSEILTNVNAYLSHIKNTFFDKLDFTNKALVNSSFLTNRILDYVFYINYSDDLEKQQELYKSSVNTVLSKIKSPTYKRDIIEFLVEQFEASKNLELIDFLFDNHYNKLPINIQNTKFKTDKLALFAAEVGRVAPDFSWTEKGNSIKLSTLNDAEHYVLVFWSTGCSHCLREIPQLYSYMKTKPNMKVVAFALENDAYVWETYKKANLKGWHNVLGLNKWENTTARTYQINATPSYFILDKNKKIIAKPNEIEDVKAFIEKM